MTARLHRHLLSWACAFFVLPTTAFAAGFHVNPVLLKLSRASPSTQLTIENENDTPVRFQVSAFVWGQTGDDDLQLTPTDVLIVFPSVITIGAHQKQALRVGMKKPPVGQEQSYRVVLEELNSVQKSDAVPNTGVKVLTRMSLPLFTEIDAPKPSAAITDVSVAKGVLTWSAKNTGNVHILPKRFLIVGRDKNGTQAFTEARPAWYMLQGRSKRHELKLPPDICARLTGLELVLEGDGPVAKTTVTMTPAQCSG